MTDTDSIRPVARPRGELTYEQKIHLHSTKERLRNAEAEYRQAVVAALDGGASFAEVSRFTRLSTQTLQRWKREEGK